MGKRRIGERHRLHVPAQAPEACLPNHGAEVVDRSPGRGRDRCLDRHRVEAERQMAARLSDERQEAAGRDVAESVVEGLIGPDEVEHDVRRSAQPEIDEILLTAKDAEVGPERLRDLRASPG